MISLLVASLLFPSDLFQDPAVPDRPESALELSMPGDPPADWVLAPRLQDRMALRMTGVIVAVEPERVWLRRRGEVDAEVSLAPETLLLVDGEAVTFDELPLGSEAEVIFDLQGVERVASEVRVGEETGAATAPPQHPPPPEGE